MVDSGLAVVVLASHVIDLRCWFPRLVGALFGIVSWLPAVETGTVPHRIFPHLVADKGLPLDCRLVSCGIAIVPGGLEVCWSGLGSGLHHTWLLGGGFIWGLLCFILPLAVIVYRLELDNRLVFTFRYECLVDQGLEVGKVQHAKLTSEGGAESSKKAIHLPFFSVHVMNRIPCQMVEPVQILAHCHVALGESKEFPLLGL